MEQIFGILVVALIGGFITFLFRKALGTWRIALHKAAREHGLQFDRGEGWTAASAQRSIGRCQLSVDGGHLNRERGGLRTLIEVRGLPTGVELDRQGALGRMRDPGVLFGDARFDDRILVRGEPLAASPLLRSRTRRLVLELVGSYPVTLKHGVLRYLDGQLLTDDDKLNTVLRLMIELTELLDDGQPLIARLAAVATTERQTPSRLRALALLCQHFPQAEETAAACRGCSGADNAQLRVAAAAGLGDHAALRKELDQPRQDPLARADALAALVELGGAHLPAEDQLIAWLDPTQRPLMEAAIDALALVGGALAVEPLTALGGGLLGDRSLKQRAHQALDRIQSRLGDRPAGGLSLVRDVGGGLSLDQGAAARPPSREEA